MSRRHDVATSARTSEPRTRFQASRAGRETALVVQTWATMGVRVVEVEVELDRP